MGSRPIWVAVVAAALTCGQTGPVSVRFENVATTAGLTFTLENSSTPQKQLIETMPGGVAAFDYDNDGRPDIFFTNGASVPGLQKHAAKYSNRLFHNEGGLKFRDVTGKAGLTGEGYSMGVAAGDFDNDGNVDLFVTGVRHNALYRNRGNGTFEDVTARSGIKSDEWSVAAGWFDFDNDGLLDLFVVNYGEWNAATDRFCGDSSKNLRVYCHPKYFAPRPNQLYRNRGDGTFEDVTAKSGIGQFRGRGMGVAFADYDGDGRMDAFVSNDNLPNSLFHNLGGGRFEEVALLAGVALLDHGKPVASMGVDFRDYDNDGRPDIAVTALNGETFPLFRNLGKGNFQDATFSSGVGQLSRSRAGWAVALVDLNNDGFKDLFSANSHVNDVVERVEAAVYKQANSVFVNQGNGKFAEGQGSGLEGAIKAHRGAAFADFDGDGRMDIVVTALGQPAELWHNVSPGAAHWLTVKLRGVRCNRDGLGAEIRMGRQVNLMTTSLGYASSSHDGVHFGLGNTAMVEAVEIRWPDGTVQVLKNVPADHVLTVIEK